MTVQSVPPQAQFRAVGAGAVGEAVAAESNEPSEGAGRGGAEALPPGPPGPLEADDLRAGSLVVPGLALIDVVWLESAAGVVRVRHLTEAGDTLEVFHLPEGATPALLEAVEGVTELVAPQQDRWVVMRAQSEAETLARYMRLLLGG